MSARQKIVSAGQALVGQRGFSAVGLSEILKSAGVPKGSFYHFFESKDAFGVALLEEYFQSYHAEMDQIIAKPGLTASEKAMLYFANWRENQGLNDCQGRCLAVKLGAEVSDISKAMRHTLKEGTDGIVARLTDLMAKGEADNSIKPSQSPEDLAANLYFLWVGASVMVKISRSHNPFDTALSASRAMLGLD
ncbi:TetR/AcrR family transcriptional regulator [Ruegeria arenilitoris]|uniref:TetR/AcrR family transcriptional regulator n=1 Tax=Ruegeria arenilitoris TaxID=1173585 RepID=UPI00147F23DB|nr:TetR/AcrR family transcriptional regulator [Ruegeria arenilitoris]